MRFLKILLGLILIPLAILMIVGTLMPRQNQPGPSRTMFQDQRERSQAKRLMEYALGLISGPKEDDQRPG